MNECLKHFEPARTSGHPPAVGGKPASTHPIKRRQHHAARCMTEAIRAGTVLAGAA